VLYLLTLKDAGTVPPRLAVKAGMEIDPNNLFSDLKDQRWTACGNRPIETKDWLVEALAKTRHISYNSMWQGAGWRNITEHRTQH
jgi:hypothetical protein